jgi:hypothetical protein
LLLYGFTASSPIIEEILDPSLKKLPAAKVDLFSLKF